MKPIQPPPVETAQVTVGDLPANLRWRFAHPEILDAPPDPEDGVYLGVRRRRRLATDAR